MTTSSCSLNCTPCILTKKIFCSKIPPVLTALVGVILVGLGPLLYFYPGLGVVALGSFIGAGGGTIVAALVWIALQCSIKCLKGKSSTSSSTAEFFDFFKTNVQHPGKIQEYIDNHNSIDPNDANENGDTALHHLCSLQAYSDQERENRVGLMERLIALGADINKPNNLGYTPLHVLAQRLNSESLLEVLLSKEGIEIDKAILNDDENGRLAGATPLHLAAHAGNNKAVEILIDHGAHIDLTCTNGYTALHVAAAAASRVEGLFTVTDEDPHTTGHAQVIRVLINGSADKTSQDKSGQTAEELAPDSLKDLFS